MKADRSSHLDLLGRVALCVLLLLALAGGLYAGTNLFFAQRQRYRALRVEVDETNAKIVRTEASISVMKARQQKLQTPEGIEDAARERLGMVRKGEVSFVVNGAQPRQAVSDEYVNVVPSQATASSASKESVLRKYFGGILF